MTKELQKEVRKHFNITVEMDEDLKKVVKYIGSTETNVLRNALYQYLKGFKNDNS